MIKENFPNEKEAKELDGFLTAPFIFCRIFESKNISIEDDMKDINDFLIKNGFNGVKPKI